MRPSTRALHLGQDPRLRLSIRSVPWVYVDEIRILVNGAGVHVIDEEIENAVLPTVARDLVRYEGELPLGGLLPPGTSDA